MFFVLERRTVRNNNIARKKTKQNSFRLSVGSKKQNQKAAGGSLIQAVFFAA